MSAITGETVNETIPAPCCAIPFTWNGALRYRCTKRAGKLGCFYGNRKWKKCELPAGKWNKQTNCLIMERRRKPLLLQGTFSVIRTIDIVIVRNYHRI